MSDRDSKNEPIKSDSVRKKAERVRGGLVSRPDRFLGLFTDRWKDLCREILREYAKAHPSAPPGKSLGATRLLRLIMEGQDADGDGVSLTKDNLFDWLTEKKDKGHLDDLKFSYIDEFIRNLQVDDQIYRKIKTMLNADADRKNREFFQSNYCSRGIERAQNVKSIMEDLVDKTFVCRPYSDYREFVDGINIDYYKEYQQIAIHFHKLEKEVLGVKAIYSVKPFWYFENREIDRFDFDVFFGYFAPSYVAQRSVLTGILILHALEYRGLEKYKPYTVSNLKLLMEDEHFGFIDEDYLMTSGFKHIGSPSSDGISPFNYDLDYLNLNAEQKDVADDVSQLKQGIFRFRESSAELASIDKFMKNLTEEYTLW